MPQTNTRPPFQCIALTLQGGGALGAYQAGVYQGLSEAQLHPNWVAGISIGAINAAIIAGNPPERRIEALRTFWTQVTVEPIWERLTTFWLPEQQSETERKLSNQLSATATLATGVAGFFTPRIPPPSFQPSGTIGATSYYDTSALRHTLERLIDFDRINSGMTRFSAGAVNIRTGNFVYFDSTTRKIGPEHVMASAALPPGFPAVDIEGESYWDGGLVSNTPLQWVLQFGPRQDTLTFEVDLWSAKGGVARNIMEVATRQKEILYSSRTRDNTDRFKEIQRVRHAMAQLIEELPNDADQAKVLPDSVRSFADRKVYNIVHLIYRTKQYEGYSKDYEFSRRSMTDHWQAGYLDTIRTLRHPQVLERPTNDDGFAAYDFSNEGSD